MRTRAVLAGVLALALTGGMGGCGAGARHGAASPSPGARSAWQLTLDRVGEDGRVDLPTALSAFAQAIGPVPGGVPVPGPAGDIPSGTIAVIWVFGHWGELTADQRAAVLHDLDAPTSQATPAGLALPADKLTPAGPVLPAGLGLHAPKAPAQDPNIACLSADSAGAEPYRAQVADIESELTGHLQPFPYPKTVFMSLNTRNIVAKAAAYTVACGPTGHGTFTGCTIHINPAATKPPYADRMRDYLVHELTHCYLYGRFGTAYDAMPQWYIEGTPNWVEEQLGTRQALGTAWTDYLDTPTWPLYRRTYSGFGFYVHLAETGTDPWKVIDPIGTAMRPLSAGGPIAETRAGWTAAGVTPAFLDSWGSGYLHGRYPGRPWTTGPGLPEYRPALGNARLGTGTVTLSAREFGVTVDQLDIDAQVVTVTPGAGTAGRLSLGDGKDAVLGTGGPYCTIAGCACPAGSPGAGTHFDELVPGQQYLGFTGGDKAGSVTLLGQNLTDYCAKPGRNCLVGQWTATSMQASGKVFSEQGGAGVRVHVDPQGRTTTVFDGMAPVTFTGTGSTKFTGHFTYRGTVTETLVLPPPTVTSGTTIGIRNADATRLSVTIHIDSPFATTVGPLSLSQLAAAGGAAPAVGAKPYLSSSWQCIGTDTLVTGGAADSFSGSWTFTRTGPG
ncbi:MAG: hypothetical protein E6F99_03180 [Actinobacteria bacterium]|nr:MAG: hypothetical protein E6F99_03180 [Actinomycetota bacterium]